MSKCRGYPDPQGYGFPLISLFVIVSLIQGSQIYRRLKGKAKLQMLKSFCLGKDQKCQNVGDTQIPSDMGTPFLYVFCYRFLNSGQPNRPKMKGQSKLTKPKVILLQKGPETPKCWGYRQIPTDMDTPFLYVFFCYRFFYSGQPNRPKTKGQSKLTNA